MGRPYLVCLMEWVMVWVRVRVGVSTRELVMVWCRCVIVRVRRSACVECLARVLGCLLVICWCALWDDCCVFM